MHSLDYHKLTYYCAFCLQYFFWSSDFNTLPPNSLQSWSIFINVPGLDSISLWEDWSIEGLSWSLVHSIRDYWQKREITPLILWYFYCNSSLCSWQVNKSICQFLQVELSTFPSERLLAILKNCFSLDFSTKRRWLLRMQLPMNYL